MRINHLGIAVKNIETSVIMYKESLGWKKLTDLLYDPVQKVNILFMGDRHGGKFELLEPVGNDSPISKMLDRRVGLYHICYEVQDINLKIKELTNTGFLLISGPVKAVAFDNKLIAFLINSDNLIIELLEQ
jgi:methylmalonyl-CoA/ethylmalonyl-CoA epimerase